MQDRIDAAGMLKHPWLSTSTLSARHIRAAYCTPVQGDDGTQLDDASEIRSSSGRSIARAAPLDGGLHSHSGTSSKASRRSRPADHGSVQLPVAKAASLVSHAGTTTKSMPRLPSKTSADDIRAMISAARTQGYVKRPLPEVYNQ